jgi:hypothetical protein
MFHYPVAETWVIIKMMTRKIIKILLGVLAGGVLGTGISYLLSMADTTNST